MTTQPAATAGIAAITVSYGSEHSLRALLGSLPEATDRPLLVAIADNMPDDGIARLADERGARYVPLASNPGYGGAINAVARHLPAPVEWILVVNPDVVLSPGAIDQLVAVGEQEASIGSVGPAILTPDGELYPSARRVPSLRIGVGHALFANMWPANPWTRSYRQDDEAHRRDAGWLSGSCVLVRRAAFDAIGGFDEAFFMYFEDVDLGMRLGRAGWRNVYEPDVRVMHVGAHSTTDRRAAMIRAHHDSANRFLKKKYPGLRWVGVRAVLRAGLAGRSLVSRIRARG
jgi:N-acetylglucosaminyl-diphospho-decaprenol L-rhamnosyltransferase